MKSFTREEGKKVKTEGDEITRRIAALIHRDPHDPEVQRLIVWHHAHIERFYPASAEVSVGLEDYMRNMKSFVRIMTALL